MEQLAQREGGQQGHQEGQQGRRRELGELVQVQGVGQRGELRQERQGSGGGGGGGRLAVLSAVVTDIDLDARVGAAGSCAVRYRATRKPRTVAC